MRASYSPEFKKALKNCPQEVEEKLYKQVAYLLQNLRHPSLHAKKYDETQNIWQARVDRNYRFYFLIENGTYVLLKITKHPK